MFLSDKLYISIFCNLVGEDQYGNKYYTKYDKSLGRDRRFVVYLGADEPSKISPTWHSWIHYLSDEIPAIKSRYIWQNEDCRLNMTGTRLAYVAPGLLNQSEFHQSRCHYKSWKP